MRFWRASGDPAVLAKWRDPRIQATVETIQKSLLGNWQPEHLFVLRQSRTLYGFYQQQIVECDQEVEKRVGAFEPRVDPILKPLPADRKGHRNEKKKRKRRGRPETGFDLRTEGYKLFGVDVTQIPGLETWCCPCSARWAGICPAAGEALPTLSPG
jgi:transposase